MGDDRLALGKETYSLKVSSYTGSLPFNFSEKIGYGDDGRYFTVGDLLLLLSIMDLPPSSNSEQSLYRASGSLK